MTRTEFKKFLPATIDWNPSSEEHAHLDSCRLCSNIVAGQIVQRAKFLLSLEEPPPRIWSAIRRRLGNSTLNRSRELPMQSERLLPSVDGSWTPEWSAHTSSN